MKYPIFDENSFLIDSVLYDDVHPWSDNADGNGPTLELVNPHFDNSLAENWTSSLEFGTPGSINSSFLSNNRGSITSSIIEIFNNYPNPFNPTTSIRYYLPENSHIKVTIYDLLGSTVKNIVDDFRYFGYHKHQWDATNNQRY